VHPQGVHDAHGRHRVCHRPQRDGEPPVEEASFVLPDGTRDVLGRPRRLVARTTERYTAVQQLLSEGKSLAAISRNPAGRRGPRRRPTWPG
jgi:hypothetical protein